MKEVRTKIFDPVFDVVEAMRGSAPRTEFLRHIIALGLKEFHAQGMRNAPKGFGLAPRKTEGEAFYLDAMVGKRIQDLMDDVGYWG